MTCADQTHANAQRVKALQATLLLRLFAVIVVWNTLPVREDLPGALITDYGLLIFPLLGINFSLLILSKDLSTYFFRYPLWLCLDIAIAVWILFLGGGWRSAYFEYTLTTVIISTIIARTKGAFFASAILALAALLKHPNPTGDPMLASQVAAWDTRLGASLFYVTTGLFLGYLNSLLDRFITLSEERITEAGRRAAMEEKMRLALNLHDRLKSKLTAILWMFKSMTQGNKGVNAVSEEDLVRLWYWLNYLQKELSSIMRSLRVADTFKESQGIAFSIHDLVSEEARIIREITGFDWEIHFNRKDVTISGATHRLLSGLLSEALTNAFKHSGKDQGCIRISGEMGQVAIEIRDRGKGFSPEGMDPDATAGIVNLKRRAKALGGELFIESVTGGGCCLRLLFPIIEKLTDVGGPSEGQGAIDNMGEG